MLRLLLIAGILGWLPCAHAQTWTSVYDRSRPAVPIIFSRGLCSGALIEEKVVLTAWHCVSDLRGTFVSFSNIEDHSIRAEVVAMDEEQDLALLRLQHSAPDVQPLPLLAAKEAVPVGANVATIGHPFSAQSRFFRLRVDYDLTHVLSAGLISKTGDGFYLTDASLSPGNSGGPALDDQGRIIGVASRKLVGMGAGDVGYLASHRSIQELRSQPQEQESIPWYKASSTSALRFIYLVDKNFEAANTKEEQIGIELDVRFWDRLRVAWGVTSIGQKEGLEYGRIGYAHRFRPSPLVSWAADINLGKNYYKFAGGIEEDSSVVTVGLEYQKIRIEAGQLLDFDENETFFLLSLNLGN